MGGGMCAVLKAATSKQSSLQQQTPRAFRTREALEKEQKEGQSVEAQAAAEIKEEGRQAG